MTDLGHRNPHIHVSEREGPHEWPDGRPDDAAWEDCLWSAAVEWARAIGRSPPATHVEAEALRAASGEPPTGGSNLGDLRRGLDARYRWRMPPPITWPAAVVVALQPGTAGVVLGSLGVFPAGHRLRRWQPDFRDGHAVYIERDRQGRWWWCDPLAPAGAGVPDEVTEAEVRAFATAAVVGPVAYREEVEMFPVVTRQPFPAPVRFTIPAGTTLRGYDPAQPGKAAKELRFATASSAHASARVGVRWVGVDPASAPVPRGAPFLEVLDGAFEGLLIVERLVRLEPLPDPCLERVRQARAELVEAAVDAIRRLER